MSDEGSLPDEILLLDDWNARLACAEQMLPIIGRLSRDRSVVTKVYGRLLVRRGPIELLRIHRHARRIVGEGLTVFDTMRILQALDQRDLQGRLRIDVGKLAVRFAREGGELDAFLDTQLQELDETRLPHRERPVDIVLYGFGRIGRLLARLIVEMSGGGKDARLRAIVVRPGKENDLLKRASLLRRDSVHGPFHGSISVDHENNTLIANGHMIHLLYASAPDQLDYTKYGIEDAILIDNTGGWRDEAGLSKHLAAPGIAKVILTAPGKGNIPNIVYGINHDEIRPDARILSAASCTTNAIVPVLKVVDQAYGVVHGHIESCHSYTNDQNLIDNFHAKPRRGRAAPLNMVITETGAAKAVAKALPGLAGKLTGNAIRVPTPNVSLAVLALQLSRPTTVEELNELLRQESLNGETQRQIDYSASPDAVSTDFVGNGHAGIVDAPATIANGTDVVLYVWYDNEFGYARQVLRLAERIAGLRPPTIPR